MSDLTEAELGYAAGVFDGEGTVGIIVTKNGVGYVYHRLMLSITNTNLEVLQWCFERWGGGLHNPRYFAKEEWREAHRWSLADRNAMEFLQDIQPYLIIKKQQAQLAIEFQQMKGKRGRGSPPPDLDARESLRKRISSLNRTGEE